MPPMLLGAVHAAPAPPVAVELPPDPPVAFAPPVPPAPPPPLGRPALPSLPPPESAIPASVPDVPPPVALPPVAFPAPPVPPAPSKPDSLPLVPWSSGAVASARYGTSIVPSTDPGASHSGPASIATLPASPPVAWAAVPPVSNVPPAPPLEPPLPVTVPPLPPVPVYVAVRPPWPPASLRADGSAKFTQAADNAAAIAGRTHLKRRVKFLQLRNPVPPCGFPRPPFLHGTPDTAHVHHGPEDPPTGKRGRLREHAWDGDPPNLPQFVLPVWRIPSDRSYDLHAVFRHQRDVCLVRSRVAGVGFDALLDRGSEITLEGIQIRLTSGEIGCCHRRVAHP